MISEKSITIIKQSNITISNLNLDPKPLFLFKSLLLKFFDFKF